MMHDQTTATCPQCRQRIPVRKDGTMVPHSKKPKASVKTMGSCSGGDQKVVGFTGGDGK